MLLSHWERRLTRCTFASFHVAYLDLIRSIQIEEVIVEDPFKLNSGGLVTGKDMKGYKTKNDAYDVGTQFYKETHIR